MLNALEPFIILAETLNFTETAKRLRVSQPNISRHIQNLEAHLGMDLFLRDRKRVVLTPEGKALFDRVSPLYRNLTDSLLHPHESSHRDTLRIGALMEIGQSIVLPRLLKFRELNPLITLQIDYQSNIDIIAKLQDGKLDVGFAFSAPENEQLRAYAWTKETSICVTRPSRHKGPMQFVAYREHDPLLLAYAKKAKLKDLSVPIIVNSHASMLRVLEDTHLHAIMPDHVAQPLLDTKKLVEVGHTTLEGNIFLLHPERRFMSDSQQALIKFLRFQ